jgi:hypothetical protein
MIKYKTVKSKSSTSRKKLKKYEEGGKEVTGLKKNSEYDAKMPAGVTMPKGDMPYGTGMKMLMKTEAVPADKLLKKIEMPEGSLPITPTAPTAAPKAKLLPGGFTSEAQKAAYIKNVKARMAKGATIDQLVKDKVGTKAGLEGLGFKDAAKTNITVKTKKSTTLPKNNVLSSVGRKGLANTASTPLPKNSKVPLKNATPKKGSNAEEALRLKAEGMKLKGQGMKLKGQGMKLKGQALATKGKKSYYKEQYHQNLIDKAIKGQSITDAENKALYEKLNNKLDSGKKLTDREAMARKATLGTAVKKGREDFTGVALTVGTILATRGRSAGPQALKSQAPKLLSKGKNLISSGAKQLTTKGSQKALGEGVKSVAKTGSKALKPDKIFKPATKALNPGQKMLGRTINVSGRTVSSGSQKALNSGQKLLNNGQTKLNAGQKLLQQGSKVSKSTAAKVNQVAKNKSLARNTRNAKLEAGIKTDNKVARSMRLKDEKANLVKKGIQRVKTSVKNAKVRNAKPKPGDQLKLDLKRGGGKFSYGRNSKKK